MELEFDFPSVDIPNEERNEFAINVGFSLPENNTSDFLLVHGLYESDYLFNINFEFTAKSEYNKYDCYQDLKSKLKIVKEGMEEELRKINSVYNDLENLSIDEFEKKYLSMPESIEDELSKDYFDKLDNIILSSDEDTTE